VVSTRSLASTFLVVPVWVLYAQFGVLGTQTRSDDEPGSVLTTFTSVAILNLEALRPGTNLSIAAIISPVGGFL
jgi:hypothetical protein